MTDMRLSDTQLAAALARIAPKEAPAGLRDRILAEAEASRQLRPVPALLRPLADADPIARRRVMLLVAAALLALGLATAGVVGALLEDRRETIPDLSLAPPADLPAFVRSTYELMPELPPMTITFMDRGQKGRIYINASGAIRTERFESPDAARPETYTILTGTTLGELSLEGGQPVWYEQRGAIMEDPRVFVFAALGAARSAPEPGCETAITPGEVYLGGEPARAWRYVGLEYVAGRPAHRVRCGDELWIDVETRLTLRSRTGIPDGAMPVPAELRTVEAIEVVMGQPPADLFEIRRPAGVALRPAVPDSPCGLDPCSSPRPAVTPSPAPPEIAPAADVEDVIAAALAARPDEQAYEVILAHTRDGFPAERVRVVHDGAGRYRIETYHQGSPAPGVTVLSGPDYRYETMLSTDEFIYWQGTSGGAWDGPPPQYPLTVGFDCADDWQIVGVDLVNGRIADHLSCPASLAPRDYWIDRETHLAVRVQSVPDALTGTDVQEVDELRFGPSPPELFELPAGAEVRE